MVIGIVAVVVVGIIVAAFFIGRGSGDNVTTSTTPTATTPTQTTPTVTTVTNVETVTTPPAPTPGAGVEIIEQSINPVSVSRSAPIALTVRTKGSVNSVRMDLSGRAPMSVELVRGPTVNEITTWAAAATAPSLAGAYTYKAIVSAADGSNVEGPNSTFTVVP